MPLHPSPLRSVETRERHRTRMTCCPPRAALSRTAVLRENHIRWSRWRNPHRAGVMTMAADGRMARCSLLAVRYGSKAEIGRLPGNVRFTPESGHRNRPAYDAATPAAWRYSPRPAAPHLSRATWPPIAGPARPRSRCKRVAGRRDRARHSRRLIPRLTKAAGAAFAVNLDQTESTKRGGVVVTPGAEQVKG